LLIHCGVGMISLHDLATNLANIDEPEKTLKDFFKLATTKSK